MVNLLIEVVCYVTKEWNRIQPYALVMKGKWKYISKIMKEKGFHISPHQCLDKFNELIKKYKAPNDVLGTNTSKVVGSHALLDSMDHISEGKKKDVMKILQSKHLFYEEMCSYSKLHIGADSSMPSSASKGRENDEASGE